MGYRNGFLLALVLLVAYHERGTCNKRCLLSDMLYAPPKVIKLLTPHQYPTIASPYIAEEVMERAPLVYSASLRNLDQ
jgi:hypothetical protein